MYSFGLELSTQSAKYLILDCKTGDIVFKDKFDFDTTFPDYQTKGGVLFSNISGLRHTSPLMLIEALEEIFKRLVKSGIDSSKIKAIKVDAMQHCTVYLSSKFSKVLKSLNTLYSLKDQISTEITRKTSPIWEDRTPEEEVELLKKWFKDPGIENLCGNRAELRFPASQIMKWAVENPSEYENTGHIFLLSAFITSILTGKISPVDTGDGWGTNLNSLDIKKPDWNKRILKSINSYLKDHGLKSVLEPKIGKMCHYDEICGKISKYFVKKYGFSSSCIVLAGTGDNPATLLGCGGNIVISLGSSYTVNGVMDDIIPSKSGEYNIFGYTKNRAMALSVITNGGKVHETFLRKYLSKEQTLTKEDWETYIDMAKRPSEELREDEPLLLPYLMDESVPLAKKGIIRDGFNEDDGILNIRALHISQVLSLKIHSSHLSSVKEICVVAGGAKNPFLRQLIADIFKVKCWSIKETDFAAVLGCAISGLKKIRNFSYEDAVKLVVKKDETSITESRSSPYIEKLITRYKMLEEKNKF